MLRSAQQSNIQTRLLQWFEKNGRDLPWRKTKDPYAIWVSEIMLQQTQVPTVIPYYQNFLKSFPTVRHLARADLSKVLKIWEGLGYYSRARNLHRASKILLDKFRGKIPDTLDDLLTLPGIGRYTVGAILSIAFNKEAPILDGNVKRVLSRLFAVSEDPKKAEDLLWKISESLLPKDRSSSFNQALMDLGSMICTPQDPLCLHCPLRLLCRGRASGNPKRYPSRVAKKRIPHIEAVSAVILKNGKVLVNRRPPTGLLGGLWEFPNWKVNRREKLTEQLVSLAKGNIGLGVNVDKPLGSFHQTFSHFKLTLHVYQCHSLARNGKGKWIPIRNLSRLPMSRIQRRIANVLSFRTPLPACLPST
jgi:A/G-specific adenine glycosylase